MARLINRLTARQVQRLTAPGMHSDGGGLYLRVDDAGRRYWLFRYASRITGKDRQYGIGPIHIFSLAEARERARACRQMLADGRDPLDERRDQKAAARRSKFHVDQDRRMPRRAGGAGARRAWVFSPSSFA